MLSITQLCGVDSSVGHCDFIHQSTIHHYGQIIHLQKIRNFQDIVMASLQNNPCFFDKIRKKEQSIEILRLLSQLLALGRSLDSCRGRIICGAEKHGEEQ